MIKTLKDTETEDTTKIVGNPNLFLLGVAIWGFLFSVTLAYYTFNPKYFTAFTLENVFIWIYASLIVLFAILCVYSILTLKKVTLTNTSLTIEYPLLFSSRDISFDDVCKVYDQDYEIKGSRNYRLYNVYEGKKTIIELYEAGKISITSLEVTNYDVLAENLKNTTKSYFKIKTYHTDVINTQRYRWFVTIIVFIFFLAVYIIQKKLG